MTKGARTREAIVDTAAQLFSVKGFCGTSIDDLVEAIGMSKGASIAISSARRKSSTPFWRRQGG